VLLNDCERAEIQQWEYVPLGPFQAKAFGTSDSPWIVTAALERFVCHGPAQDPKPLQYTDSRRSRTITNCSSNRLAGAQMTKREYKPYHSNT